MKIRIATDNVLELVGGALLVAGIAVICGLGPALLAAAFCVLMLAEFTYAGHSVGVRLPKLPRFALRERRLVRRQLKTNLEDFARRARKIERQRTEERAPDA